MSQGTNKERLTQNNQKIDDLITLLKTKTVEPDAVEEWQPNPTWWDIEKILAEDTRDYAYKAIILLPAVGDSIRPSETATTLNSFAYATSDGAFYETNRALHTWDKTKDKPCLVDGVEAYKTRYIVMYTNSNPLDTLPEMGILKWVAGDKKINSSSFYGCYNLISTKGVRSYSGAYMKNAFQNCRNLKHIDYIDTSSNTTFENMFYNCYNLKEVPHLNTSNGTNFSGMFWVCRLLKSIPELDTSKGTDFNKMFSSCNSLITIPQLNTSNGTDFGSMFDACYTLTNIPELDTSNGTNFSAMFRDCYSLKTIPKLNTSNGTSFVSMFEDCSGLTNVTLLDTSNGTSFSSMFNRCHALEAVPRLNTSNGTNFSSMFYGCNNLTEVPQLDTSNGTRFDSMFYDCYSLETIPLLNLINATSSSSLSSIFNNCRKLENVNIKNIRANLTLGSGTNYGTLITKESFLNTIKELWDLTGGTIQSLAISTSINKYKELYVRLIDITDEMRAEDPYIDNKKPFEECESTDDGAMLVTEYITSKNWQLKN